MVRARSQLIFWPPFCHSERSRGCNAADVVGEARLSISNYFRCHGTITSGFYIVTNEHDSVLYVGMTNDLARRITEHRTGEIPSFATDYRCRKTGLLRTLHRGARCHRTRETAQEMVASKESGIDCNSQPTLEGSGAGDPRRIVRDVSTSLDMTKGKCSRW